MTVGASLGTERYNMSCLGAPRALKQDHSARVSDNDASVNHERCTKAYMRTEVGVTGFTRHR